MAKRTDKRLATSEDALISLRARLVTVLDALRQTQPAALGERCYRSIRQAVLRAHTLPPDEVTFQRWFRAACQRADGSDYSHSQRALFVHQFNAASQHWANERLIDKPLVVSNYRRRRPGGVADPRVYQTIRPSEMEQLKQTFLEQLAHSPFTEQDAQWLAFYRLAFVFIVWGGMAWPGALANLAQMTWQDLRTVTDGFIRITRHGVDLRLWAPPIVQAFALALGASLPRQRTFGEPDPSQPLVPIEVAGDNQGSEQKRLQAIRHQFDKWLHDLCLEAGVHPIGVRVLQGAARLEMTSIYGNVLSGAILGLNPYAPVPEAQSIVFDTYLEAFTLPRLPAAPLPAAHSPTTPARAMPQTEFAERDSSNYQLEEMIEQLQAVLRPLSTASVAGRTRAASELESLARDLLGAAAKADLPSAFAAAREVNGNDFNMAALAAWLAHLCRDTPLKPLSILAYRSSGSVLLRHIASQCWDELDEDDAQEIAALEMSASARSRLLTVLLKITRYLKQNLRMEVALNLRGLPRLRRVLRPVNLPAMTDIEQMLARLLAWRSSALARKQPDKARLAYSAFLAILLSTFFGLRRREVCHLRLGDMVLDSHQPYVHIRRSKRGKSRVVWARHIPPEVLDALRAEWQRRWKQSRGDPSMCFLDSDESDEVLIESLGRAVNAAIRSLDIAQSPDALPITFHTLRHVYANRALVLGVPLIEISRSMGHANTDTTTTVYLHAFDYLQRKRLDEWLAAQPKSGLTACQIGGLLGVKRTAALAALAKLPLEECVGWQEEGKHLYPWAAAAKLQASRLRMMATGPGIA